MVSLSTALLFVAVAISRVSAVDIEFFGPACTADKPLSCPLKSVCDVNGVDFKGVQGVKSCLAPTTCSTSDYQTFDGTCNNLNLSKGFFGVANSFEDRWVPAKAAQPASRPRDISDKVMKQRGGRPNTFGSNAITMAMGQFLVHDIAVTPTVNVTKKIEATEPIMHDFKFKFSKGQGTGTDRSFINKLTSYLDLSTIYGNSEAECMQIRANYSGLLNCRMVDGEELLFIEDGHFVSGDARVSENPLLTALHILFVREHNRLAREFSESGNYTANVTGSGDEEIFQQTRRINIAQFQHIIYDEYLPAIIGEKLPEFSAYNPDVNPSVHLSFAGAISRFGHSQANNEILMSWRETNASMTLPLADAFFNVTVLETFGVNAILEGGLDQCSETIDRHIDDSLRNMLFGNNNMGRGMDLAAINIERGRSHYLSDINSYREAFGLSAFANFSDLLGNDAGQQCVADALNEVYPNGVGQSDFWVAGLAEELADSGQLGETFKRGMIEQMTALRDGDRFYFENRDAGLSRAEIVAVKTVTLGQLIRRNTNMTHFADNAFNATQCCSFDGKASANFVCNKVTGELLTTLTACEVAEGLGDIYAFPGTEGFNCVCHNSQEKQEEQKDANGSATESRPSSVAFLISALAVYASTNYIFG